MTSTRTQWLLALIVGVAAGVTMAQGQTVSPPACAAAEYRQFDFWLGEWDVRSAPDGGTLLGTSRIERSDNGCWITEHWHGASGGDGSSRNAWDAGYGVWRQFWTGADGTVLRLEGGMREGAMVMQGELRRSGGGVQLQKISWTPHADGSLTQHWQTSNDDGATWQDSFVGIYRHRAPAGRPR